MKKIIAMISLIGLALASMTFVGCGSKSAGYTVGICQLVQHPALDKATQGFKDVLTEEFGEAITIEEGNASGDSATCSTICNGYVSEGVDLIMANATPALQAAASATNSIPVLGTSISGYGAALGIDDFKDVVGGNISGTIAKRLPKSEYIFPEGFRIAGEAYLSMRQSEGYIKDSTLRNHRHRLVDATLFFESHRVTGIEFVNTEIINLYLKTLAGCSQSYLSEVIHTLSHFLEFSSKQGYLSTSFVFPTVSVYKDRKIPEYYSPEEISGILSAIDRGNSLGKRNYAMILLAARYGLRIGDIRTLKLTDVNFNTNQIHIIQQKTSKPLTLDLLPDVGWALIDYLKYGRPQVSAAEIFLRHVHPYGPLGKTDNMGYVIRQYAIAAGIRKNTEKAHHCFHMLRYSLASDLIQQGISLTTISGILGHSQLSVTSRYTQLDIPQLMDCALEVPV